MNTFLSKVEPHLTSDDHLVLQTVMYSLSDYPCKPVEWTARLLRKARESLWSERSIIHNLEKVTFDEEAMEELIFSLRQTKRTSIHLYLKLFDSIEPEMLLQYKEELAPFISEEGWKFYSFLANCEDEKEAYGQYDSIVSALNEEQYFNQPLFRTGKRIIDLLVSRGWMDGKKIDLILDAQRENTYFDGEGLLAVYAMGLLQENRWIPQLAEMFTMNDDILMEIADEALIRYQNDEVVDALYPICKTDDYIFPIGILQDIKTPHAVDALKRLYQESDDLDKKEQIAEGLCLQFAKEGVPEVTEVMDSGYTSMMTDMEEAAYGFFQVIGESHPYLSLWKKNALEREYYFHERMDASAENRPVVKLEKIGRNDPCFCGSGKKYKKCCGA